MVDLAGVILAGGQSRRMGRDKAQLSYGGKLLIEHMATILTQAGATSVYISGKAGVHSHGIEDLMPGTGPVGGVCSVLAATEARSWCFVPVDMPLLTPELLRRLAVVPDEAVYFADTPLPLFLRRTNAVMKRATGVLEHLREGNNLSLWSFLEPLKAAPLVMEAESRRKLSNMNTPHDWMLLTGETL